jgi:hypothetical protein
MWAHAEDLDTLEFTLMQVISHIAGPVRSPLLFLGVLVLLTKCSHLGCGRRRSRRGMWIVRVIKMRDLMVLEQGHRVL